MERDTEIIQAAQSIVVHLPALLGERADSVGAQLDLLLAEWDREPNPSVIDRILALLEGSPATREWMAGFLRLSAPAPARPHARGGPRPRADRNPGAGASGVSEGDRA